MRKLQGSGLLTMLLIAYGLLALHHVLPDGQVAKFDLCFSLGMQVCCVFLFAIASPQNAWRVVILLLGIPVILSPLEHIEFTALCLKISELISQSPIGYGAGLFIVFLVMVILGLLDTWRAQKYEGNRVKDKTIPPQ